MQKNLNSDYYSITCRNVANVGTISVAPLASKQSESDIVIDIGEIKNSEVFFIVK